MPIELANSLLIFFLDGAEALHYSQNTKHCFCCRNSCCSAAAVLLTLAFVAAFVADFLAAPLWLTITFAAELVASTAAAKLAAAHVVAGVIPPTDVVAATAVAPVDAKSTASAP